MPLPHQYGTDTAATVLIDVAGAGFAVPDVNEDESYSLDVTGAHAVLTAATVVGALHGLETLLQLQNADARGFYFEGARVHDAPRFKWRGLLVDVGRHFETVDAMKRTLDGMAVVKLNVLHWHLSEDQGFRVESMRFPRLQEMGSDGLYYTQAQIRDIVQYATDRGIRVVPEFDVPGHSTAWLVGYPDLASGPGPYSIARGWGTFPGTMDPTRQSTYDFLDAFIGEMATLFPDHYWHIGGDEVNPLQWKRSTAIQAWMKQNGIADEKGLQTAFNRRLFDILKAHGKVPVGWDEILEPDLPTDAVIQSWRSTKALLTAASLGHQGILSQPYYLDHINTAAEHYVADPLPSNTDLTPAQQALILGGEACMWGEYVTGETIDSRIWPRLAAIAERFWSPTTVTDVPDMYRRLEITSRRLAEVGTRQEGHTTRMVREIAGGTDALTLDQLLDYARPKGFGNYGSDPLGANKHTTDQFSPHTRLIDAAQPDPWSGWHLLDRADRAVAGDSTAADSLRSDFARMIALQAALSATATRVPVAQEGLAVAAMLHALGALGNEALDVMAHPATGTAAWRLQADSTLRVARRSTGLLRPVGADAVRVLVDAAEKGLPPGTGTP
jgi:hexosaminidase